MLIIFDWDGTLIDSTAKIVASMQTAARYCGVERLDDLVIKNIIGLGLPEAIQVLYPKLDNPRRMDIQKAYSAAYIEADRTPCQFYAGVEECLSNLQKDGHKIAIATGKSRKGLQRVLENTGWNNKFDASRCADETASKPHPRMLIELMSELNADASQSVMVGDTEYDLQMAKNANMRSVGVSYGAHESDRLNNHSPIAIIDNLLDLPKYIF